MWMPEHSFRIENVPHALDPFTEVEDWCSRTDLNLLRSVALSTRDRLLRRRFGYVRMLRARCKFPARKPIF
jgi:hypothetical protein